MSPSSLTPLHWALIAGAIVLAYHFGLFDGLIDRLRGRGPTPPPPTPQGVPQGPSSPPPLSHALTLLHAAASQEGFQRAAAREAERVVEAAAAGVVFHHAAPQAPPAAPAPNP